MDKLARGWSKSDNASGQTYVGQYPRVENGRSSPFKSSFNWKISSDIRAGKDLRGNLSLKYSGRLTLIRERDSRYVWYRRGRTFYEIYIGRTIDARERDREYGRTKCEECRVQDNGFTWEQQSRGEVRVLERPRISNDSHPASVQIESRPVKISINSNYILFSHNIVTIRSSDT